MHNCERFGQLYYSMYVPQIPCTFSIAPMGNLLTRLPQLTLAQLPTTLWSTFQGVRVTETLNKPHRPNGRLTFCLLFAGRRCLCQWWHSVNRELPDLLQLSLCARHSCSKVPIAPMGKLLTCLPRLTLAQLPTTLWSTFQEVRATETLKTSHRPDGKMPC